MKAKAKLLASLWLHFNSNNSFSCTSTCQYMLHQYLSVHAVVL